MVVVEVEEEEAEEETRDRGGVVEGPPLALLPPSVRRGGCDGGCEWRLWCRQGLCVCMYV